MTNILCKKREKSCDKQTKEWWSLFTQIQIFTISNLCCEKQALIHVQFSYIVFFFSKCYCTVTCFIVLLLSVITISSSSLVISCSYHPSHYHGYSGFLLFRRLKNVIFIFQLLLCFFSHSLILNALSRYLLWCEGETECI